MFELKKIGIIKRASAGLLDLILLAVLATGFIYVISLICHFEREADLSEQYFGEWSSYQKDCIPSVAAHYGFTYTVGEDGDYTVEKDGQTLGLDDIVGALIEDVSGYYGFTFGRGSNSGEYTLKDPAGAPADVAAVAEAIRSSGKERHEMADAFEKYAALTPESVLGAQYRYVASMLFMMVSVGLLLAFLILEFIVPLCFGNGQTIGKKVFSICLVRPDCVRISAIALFGRMLLGKYAIETMFPVLLVFMLIYRVLGWVSIILLAALLILDVVLFFATKNHTPIHDILAFTVAADMKEQMIYASAEELNEKKAQARKDAAEAALLEKDKY